MPDSITLLDEEVPHIAEVRPITKRMRKRLKGYYQQSARWPWYLLGLGCLLLIVGWLSWQVGSILSGTTLFLLATHFILQPLNVATTQEVDEIARNDFQSIGALALRRSQLQANELVHDEPCCFRNGVSSLPTELGSVFTGERRARDLKVRWTPHELSVVHFGHEQLFLYNCVFDLSTGHATNERTREFFYRDIVSVDTDAETITIKLKDADLRGYWQQRGARMFGKTLQVDARQVVSLQLASGERVVVADWDGYSSSGLEPDEVSMNTLATERLRRLVREFRQHGPRQIAPPRIVRHTRNTA